MAVVEAHDLRRVYRTHTGTLRRRVKEIEAVIFFKQEKGDEYRISLRSKSEKVNVNEIAAQFGGGGHPAAAGARIPGRPLSVQRKVIGAVKKALNSSH